MSYQPVLCLLEDFRYAVKSHDTLYMYQLVWRLKDVFVLPA